ncbi:hypothetical protein K491DRAFT_721237 [Lophiostoma macrostomum CBS 122681]|uniref:Aminoglycoside phosphotransferase domain-containing protein n=1 Tax=Lophiostoma macrostomum CBS 122681 TaxID=1314788 RepID=A0A6A6STY1_9PLEO|nr:hypothetical protein K491DRAFT_721237 [Lophiostoma macrostomum CBS 122681]
MARDEMTVLGEQTRLDYFGSADMYLNVLKIEELKNFDRDSYNEAIFPYKAEGPLDTPLPTVRDIHAAFLADAGADYTHVRENPKSVTLLMEPYYVKVSLRGVVMREAENMIYLEKNSAVRTAKLYAAFSSREVNIFNLNEEETPLCHYVIQGVVKGENLYDLRDDLDLPYNRKICEQLGAMMAEQLGKLRDTPPENPNHFGNVNGRPYNSFNTSVIFPEDLDNPTYGPFTYEQLVDRMIHSSRIVKAYTSQPNSFSIEFGRNARRGLIEITTPDDRLPVLSHMDLDGSNVIIQVKRSEKEGEEKKIIAIENVVFIDWELMCWMPGWYEAGRVYNLSDIAYGNIFKAFGSYESIMAMGHMKPVPFAYFTTANTISYNIIQFLIYLFFS